MKPSKKTPQKKASPAAAKTASSAPVITSSSAPSQPAKAAAGPAKTVTSTTPTPAALPARKDVTIVKAKVDVGFGNTLFIRGQGCGLSWDKGIPLVCLDASSWVWSTDKANEKISFKLLVNDQVWAQGEDLVVAPGQQVEAAPVF